MRIPLLKTVLTNLNLKLFSLIIGYTLWSFFSTSHPITRSFTIPLCFYHKLEKTIIAPEQITVQLRATRTDLDNLDHEQLAAHIDVQSLHKGINHATITDHTLLLPPQIKLVNYCPSNLTIKVKEKA